MGGGPRWLRRRGEGADKSACGLMHVIAHFTRTLLHSGDGGTQLLSRHIPIYNFLRLSSDGALATVRLSTRKRTRTVRITPLTKPAR